MWINVHAREREDGKTEIELEEWGRPYVSVVPDGCTIHEIARVLLMDWTEMDQATVEDIELVVWVH